MQDLSNKGMAIEGFVGKKHVAEDGEGLREHIERGTGSDERIEEESGLAIGEGEEDIGLVL